MTFRSATRNDKGRAHSPEDKARVRQAFIDAGKQLMRTEEPESVSLRRIASAAGYSPGTIYQYFHDHRELLSGACLWICHSGAPLHYATITSLCMDMFGLRVDMSWVRRFCQEFGLSRHRLRARSPATLGENYLDECLAFLQAMRNDSPEPSHLYAMDEKGVWDNAHPNYGLEPRGR